MLSYIKKTKYISLQEASRLCSYSQEYLSLLARRNLLPSKKIDGKWHTTQEWLNQYLEKNKPEEVIIEKDENKSDLPIKKKNSAAWFILAAGLSFLILAFIIFQSLSSQIKRLEEKTANVNNDKSNLVYPYNLPGYADWFAPSEKLEF
jgi:hypothetical protein